MPSGQPPSAGALAILLCVALAICSGCDLLSQVTPPEKLPSVPEKCVPLSDQHRSVLTAAFSSVDASQLQVVKVANEFAQCMQDEGLSKAETKGLLKKNEEEVKKEVEQGKADIIIR